MKKKDILETLNAFSEEVLDDYALVYQNLNNPELIVGMKGDEPWPD